jgi:hypothetical protein
MFHDLMNDLSFGCILASVPQLELLCEPGEVFVPSPCVCYDVEGVVWVSGDDCVIYDPPVIVEEDGKCRLKGCE